MLGKNNASDGQPESGHKTLPSSVPNLLIENEQLRRKVKKLKKLNSELQKDLTDTRDLQKLETWKKQFVTTHNMEVQTDAPKSWLGTLSGPPKRPEKQPQPEGERVNKLLNMHNSVMRRYEKELKVNMQHVETITSLNLKINELEQQVKESHMQVHKLELELRQARSKHPKRRPTGRRGSASSDTSENIDVPLQMRKLQREKDQLLEDKKKLKAELKGLDPGFFEEIEDLKFALQQSATLNLEYEKTLRQFCQRYGVPYPHPEKKIKLVR